MKSCLAAEHPKALILKLRELNYLEEKKNISCVSMEHPASFPFSSSHFSFLFHIPISIQNNMADDPSVEQASTAEEQHQPSDEEREGACKIVPKFEISFERCFMCGIEHDSPEFGPYCALCHDFLYPNALLVRERGNDNAECASSGEPVPSITAASESDEVAVCPTGVGLDSDDSGCESEKENTPEKENSATCTSRSVSTSVPRYKLPYLSLYERVRAPDLVAKRLANELSFVEEDLFETLPPESELIILII